MSGRATWRRAISAAAILIAATQDARAEDTNRVAAATLLFDEGVRALDAGRLEEACTKLHKSQDLAPSGGTLLALAECQERAGHYASAWVAFRGAAARAAAAGKADAEASALDHAAKLEPKLARLTLHVPSPVPNLELIRDGSIVSASELDVAVPVDPGKHEIRANAPGAEPWTRTITVTSGAATTVEVPSLAAKKPVEEPVDDSPGNTQRTIAYVAGGVGLGALITGGVFGLIAKSTNDRSDPDCHDHLCSQEGLDLIHRAQDQATVANIMFITGAVLIVGAGFLYLTATPATSKKSAKLDLSNTIFRW